MTETYGAEETQGKEGPFDFYFQTHGAEPGELKEELDEICGPGRYALKMVDVDRWILITSKRLSQKQQDRLKHHGSVPDDDQTTWSSPPPAFQHVRTETNISYFGPVTRTGTSATQRSKRGLQDSAVAAMINLWSKIRKGKREPSGAEESQQSPWSNMTSSPPTPSPATPAGTV